MHRFMVAASAASMLLVSSMAALAEEANGSIASIDPVAGTVTLADGQTYMLPQDFDTASLQVGQEVTITYEQDDSGGMQATEVAPSS